MRDMTDTDLRVVLCVVRATFGWIADLETGMRKEEDWISHWQLSKKTGRSGRALSTAIDQCIKKDWIEARDENGVILDTKAKRRGQKIYYRIGKAIILTTSEKSSEVVVSSEKTSNEDGSNEKSSRYKTNSYTKEKLLQNTASPSANADIPMDLKEFVGWCDKSRQRYIQIIGTWADTIEPNFTTKKQWESFIKRNLRAAKNLEPFEDERLKKAYRELREAVREGWLKKFSLETLYKFVMNHEIK
jgi:hypothetical protein